MASKNWAQAVERGLVIIPGSFTVDGSGDPATLLGAGFTAAHTTTGVYTITLLDTPYKVISVTASVSKTGTAAVRAVVPVIPFTGAAVVLQVIASNAALTNLATDERLEFTICIDSSSV